MLQLRPLSSLAKVFLDEAPTDEIFSGCSFLRGEEVSFQIAFCSDREDAVFPEITGEGCEAFWVENIPAGNACGENADDYFLRRTPGLYPDLLRPATAPKQIKKDEWHSLWITRDSGVSQEIHVRLGGEEVRLRFACIPAELPEQTLLCTHWLHYDCLAQAYGTEAFSEAHWEIIENYVRCAVAHGTNLLFTPLFTPPLDTAIGGERLTIQLVDVLEEPAGVYRFDFGKLERWFAMGRRCGAKAYELSHLFTQWGAKHAPKIIVNGARRFGWDTDADSPAYTDFLTQFGASLMRFLAAHDLTERCYAHVSDEPSLDDIEMYARKAALIQKIFPGVKRIDALSDYAFYERGLIERPIPSNNAIAPFIGHVPELWTYYCCGERTHYVSNRFFAMPSERNRVLGLQLWKFRCAGFLHWAFNFWNAQFSTRAIDPFTCTDAGGGFPSGDPFLVYPGNGGRPLCSLRLKVFHEALQDMRALQLLERLIGYDDTLHVLEEGLETPLTFSAYPHSAAWLLDARARVNRMISAKISACILSQNTI